MVFQRHFLVSSLLIHALVLFAYWFLIPASVKVSSPMKINIIEQENNKLKGKNTAMKSSSRGHSYRSAKSKGTSQNVLDGYLPNYQFQSLLTQGNEDTYSSNPRRDDPNVAWGSGAGTFGRIQDFNFYKVLYGQVDGSLHYPGVLARNKIKGTVNARIVVDKTGDCNWQNTKIQGSNAYLGLYVLDVLKSVCKMNFKKYLGDREIANADLSFKFDINENNESERIDKEKIIVGNALLFYRNSHQSITQWELGPFKGIFPVPAIYLNIPWIQEHWDSLVNQKDPLNEFKKQFGDS